MLQSENPIKISSLSECPIEIYVTKQLSNRNLHYKASVQSKSTLQSECPIVIYVTKRVSNRNVRYKASVQS